jgi:hypothetical protein
MKKEAMTTRSANVKSAWAVARSLQYLRLFRGHAKD